MSPRRALVPRALGSAFLALAVAFSVMTGWADVDAQASPNSIEIRGAAAMLPLAQRVAEAYMTDHPDTTITVSGGGAYRGLKSIIVGTAEVAMATEDVPDDLARLAKDRKVELRRVDVYKDAVVVVVHPSNPIEDLRIQQVRDLFRGVLKRWSDVGGKDEPVVVTTFGGFTGTYDVFKHHLLGEEAVVTPEAKVVTRKTLAAALVPGAIGYCGLQEVGALKALKIDGVAASTDTVRSGKYPVVRVSALYQRGSGSNLGNKVLEYFLTDKSQKLVAELGDVPIK